METTDAAAKFQNRDFWTDFRPEVSLSSSHAGLLFWKFMVAGSIAGSVKHMAIFPVDTIKTRMQALGSHPARSFGLRHALLSILKHDGPLGLYLGIGAMGLGAGLAHAVYFSVYEVCKDYFSHGNPSNPTAHAMSGFTPMDMIEQRLQLQNSPYKGVLDYVKRVLKDDVLLY